MPASENGTVVQLVTNSAPRTTFTVTPPRRVKNSERRPREHLTDGEVEILRQTAKNRGRYGERDACAILVAYTHGLRVSELCRLTWPQIDFKDGVLHVTRVKNGRASTQPLRGQEIRELRKLRRHWPEGRFVFQNERGAPLTPAGFRKTIARIGEFSPLAFPIHPHMLRHACGFKLANEGVDTRTLQQYLGHRDIQHTVVYSELAADRFNGFWRD
jgi:integrase